MFRFKVAPGMELLVGLSTDFFVEEADAWRDEAWAVIRERPDIVFRILTKRARRIRDHLPSDWGDGYENVMLQVTTENQTRVDERLPILLDVPARHKGFMAAPLIGPVDAERYLATGQFEQVLCGARTTTGHGLAITNGRRVWATSAADTTSRSTSSRPARCSSRTERSTAYPTSGYRADRRTFRA